jgi:hypothetical protein
MRIEAAARALHAPVRSARNIDSASWWQQAATRTTRSATLFRLNSIAVNVSSFLILKMFNEMKLM